MSLPSAKLLILRGNDPSRIKEELDLLKSDLGEESIASMNITVFDGDKLTLEELRAACLTMPFLAEYRLVILEKARQYLAKINKASEEKAKEFLEDLPETSCLAILVEDDLVIRRKERVWVNAKAYQWLIDWVHEASGRGKVVNCELPADSEMPQWILKKVQTLEGAMEPAAAHVLASYLGNDTLRAGHEIEKLLNYTGGKRPVTAQDVILLTAQNLEGDIFELTDALGEKDGRKAMRQFRVLSEESEMMELAPMIQRHFRQLIQVREILDEGGQPKTVEAELNLHSFVAQKLANQARRFSLPQLIRIYGNLLELDEAMKTGGLPGEISFELLIARLTT